MVAAFFSCVVLLLTIILFLIQWSTRRRRHRNLPPSGPLCLPVIGHLHLMRQPLHYSLARISAHHGPLLLLRFGNRRVLVVNTPSLVEECFTANDVAFANRPFLLSGKHFGYGNTTLATAPYGPHWQNLRRIATVHVFSAARISTLATIGAVEVRSLLLQLFHGEFAVKEIGSTSKHPLSPEAEETKILLPPFKVGTSATSSEEWWGTALKQLQVIAHSTIKSGYVETTSLKEEIGRLRREADDLRQKEDHLRQANDLLKEEKDFLRNERDSLLKDKENLVTEKV